MMAYFDCFSGISGDMTLGALVDLGVPVPYLVDRLRQLPLSGFDITESRVMRHGITAVDIRVTADESAPSRDYAAISALIGGAVLSEPVKQMSLAIFDRIAAAEATIHGCPKESVHFHEVGGIDALVDIIGTALCVEYLGLKTIIGSPVPLGRGFVTARHGVLPVPAPATLEILKGIPVTGTDLAQEWVTPTGAAILATLCSGFQQWPPMKIARIGYGAGKKDPAERPNLLRVVVGDDGRIPAVEVTTEVVVIETSIDDMNPEIYGYLMERLFADGALDVFWTPIQMKKNRPGTLVTVLCPEEMKDSIVYRLLSETTTAGLRSYGVERHTLHRETKMVETRFGPVAVKKIVGPGGEAGWVPEYEACKTIALHQGMPLKTVYQMICALFPLLDKDGAEL